MLHHVAHLTHGYANASTYIPLLILIILHWDSLDRFAVKSSIRVLLYSTEGFLYKAKMVKTYTVQGLSGEGIGGKMYYWGASMSNPT